MSEPQRRLILIVGVQKSGTTLLARLLQEAGIASNPFDGEGDAFWGNEPPLAPAGDPAGSIYQGARGERGHEASAEDADARTRDLLCARLAALEPGSRGPILNKNPYNTVRLPWLRALFPDALIVTLLRQPVANAYSLAKKYVPHKQSGLAPDEGWWGVKPAGWRALVSDDKLLQSALQWDAVNAVVARDRSLVDLFVPYRDLCARPAFYAAEIHRLASGAPLPFAPELPPLTCFDAEFERGSRLRSKNRYYKEIGSLAVPADEPIEFDALGKAEVESVSRATARARALLAAWLC